MGLRRKFLILSISLLPLIAGAADFAIIPIKNVFRLLPPKQEQKTQKINPELAQVIPQGVTRILGSRQALLKILSKAKPAAVEVQCILGEGQEQNGVKVLRIEIETGTIWLRNQGVEQVVALDP